MFLRLTFLLRFSPSLPLLSSRVWSSMLPRVSPPVLGTLTALFALFVGLVPGMVPAQAADVWPSKPIRLVVPFPAGGPTDILSRAVVQELGSLLGQALVVDNKPGAGGTIGVVAAAKSPADGYTLLFTSSSTQTIGPAINAHLPYNPETDFTPIVAVASSPQILLVPITSPAHNLHEFIAYARQHPGQLNYASAGNGTVSHLSTEILKAQAGIYMLHIPYRGTGLSLTDLVSGKVDLLMDAVISAMPHVKDGKLRALAVTSLKRSALVPDLPAVAEELPGFDAVPWFGIYGPKGLPPEIVQRVNHAVNAVLAQPEFRQRLAHLGAEPMGGTPQQFEAMAQADFAKWRKVIVERQLRLD